MALKVYSRRNIYKLDDILNQKFDAAKVLKTLDDVVSVNSVDSVPSSAAIVALKTELENKINDAKSFAQSLIDDTVESGSDKTWSVDKIKQFVASVDDTVVVQNIDERNNLKAYDSLIAFVLDTSGDDSLTEEFRGKPYAYIYANGQWQPLSPVAGEIDSDTFVKYTDIVNDVTTGGAKKVLSAEMGKYLDGRITQVAQSTSVTLVTESVKVNGDKLALSANPIGSLVMNCAEVSTDNGIEVVDASVTGDKEVTLQPATSGEYDGKVARVTYLALITDVQSSNSDNSDSSSNDSSSNDSNSSSDSSSSDSSSSDSNS